MTHLNGKDLAWLRHGIRLFDNPKQMARLVKRFALKEGPKNWVWKYGWPTVEDAIFALWPAEGDRMLPSPARFSWTSERREA